MLYGILSPLTLALIPFGVAALIWAYRKHGRGERILVSSTLLFQQLEKHAAFRSRFRPPLRFFLELLLLLLLVLAAAGLYEKERSDTVAVLIDNSFSMNQQSREALGSSTALARAKEKASDFLFELDSNTDVALFLTSPKLTQVSGRSLRNAAARERLSEITAFFGGDALNSAIEQLSRDAAYDQLAVFSDYPIEKFVSPDGVVTSEQPVKVFSVRNENSSAPTNIAITGIQVNDSSQKQDTGTLIVEVSVFGDREVRGMLEVRRLVETNLSADPILVRSARFEISGNKKKQLRFKNLLLRTPYIIQLTKLTALPGGWTDPLEGDNRAWIAPRTHQKVIDVVGNRSLTQLGLHALAAWKFRHTLPEKYSTDRLNRHTSMIIFDRFAPDTLPPTSALFVLPPNRRAPISTLDFISRTELTEWNGTHPLLTYLNVPALRLRGAHPLQKPSWSEELISVSEGPLFVAGEFGGKRYAALGFDPFPYQGNRSPVLSILLLNSVKWLATLSSSNYFFEINEALSGYSDKVAIQAPLESFETRKTPNGETEIAFRRPGIFPVKEPRALPSPIAVNYFDTSESDLVRHPKVNIPEQFNRTESPEKEAIQSLTEYFAWLAFILILLDLLVFTLFSPIKRLFRRSELSKERLA